VSSDTKGSVMVGVMPAIRRLGSITQVAAGRCVLAPGPGGYGDTVRRDAVYFSFQAEEPWPTGSVLDKVKR